MTSQEHPKGDILLVDDTPHNLRLLTSMLAKQGYKVRSAINGSMAIMGATSSPPDLILLDITMPEMSGYEVCQRLKANELTADIPVIFMSALDETWDKVKAFSVGGVDYITKPIQIAEVLVRVATHIKLRNLQKHLQTLNRELEDRVQDRTAQLEETNRALQAEVQERQQAQAKLWHLALHDPLTDLPNRAFLMQRLQKLLEQSRAEERFQFAVLFLDCDRFKTVNDSLGHLVGDQLLVGIAQRLQKQLPDTCTLTRLGGDEFTILVSPVTHADQIIRIAEQIQQGLAAPFRLSDRDVFISASIGIVLSNVDYTQPEHLLRDADTAMYQAKAQGKACYQIFTPCMHADALQQLQLENDLRRALEQSELWVEYQPIVSLSSGEICSFEALVRWQHPERGIISPTVFIPIAEETGLIVPLGEWVLRQACEQLCQWQALLAHHPIQSDLTISVNLSARQFAQVNLIDRIDQILHVTGLDSQCLKLEITESAIMDNSESVTDILKSLKARKIQLSIDDFGTGYSSLSYLHRFPVDTLKIDRAFVQRIGDQGENLEIVRAIVALATSLGMTIIAEGVETSYQHNHLHHLGCHFGQGYYFSKALRPEVATDLLLSSTHKRYSA